MKQLYALVLVCLLFIGCGHHHRHHHVTNLPDTTIDGVTVSFWDTLTEAQRQELIDYIRSEIVAWEVEHQDHVTNLVIDLILSGTIEVDITESGFIISCDDDLDLPPGLLRNWLCIWYDQGTGHGDTDWTSGDDD